MIIYKGHILKLTAAEYLHALCVYAHKVNNEYVFIDVGTVRDAFDLTKMINNGRWQEVVASNELSIEFLHFGRAGDRTQMNAVKTQLLNIHKPPANLDKSRIGPMVILCNETGATWRTIAECAQSTGASMSALSNHLNQRPGFKTVKGLTFQRIHGYVKPV